MYVPLKNALVKQIREVAAPGKTITIVCTKGGGYHVDVAWTEKPFISSVPWPDREEEAAR